MVGIRGQGAKITTDAFKKIAEITAKKVAKQLTSKAAAMVTNAKTAFLPTVRRIKKTLKAIKQRVKKAAKKGEKTVRTLLRKQLGEKAEDFHDSNQELEVISLKNLRKDIKPGDTKEEILKKVRDYYGDVSLADEAFEFLLETTRGELFNKILDVKEGFNTEHEREIKAGRNIMAEAQAASKEGLGTPTSLRELYRDVTGNPRDSMTLFEEFSRKYDFNELEKVTNFLLHSLGQDMKSGGPSIEPGKLHRLMTETRSIQAIRGVYKFYAGRMALVKKQFDQNGISKPKRLTFENMAYAFISFARERYPSRDKILNSLQRLGLSK